MLRTYIKTFLKSPSINTLKTSTRKYSARRALLYVPASDLKKVLKAFVLDVDCIALDCEDGVAMNRKAQARLNIRDLLDRGKPVKKRNYDLTVRVNSFHSGLLREDLSMILTGKHIPDTILLPKLESVHDLKVFSGYISEFIKTPKKIGVILGIESATALINVVDICHAAEKIKALPDTKFKLVGLLWGSDDFCASVGARRSDSAIETMYARQKLVTVAKAFNLQAIDMVYIKYKDMEGLKKQAEEGAQWGYTGKQIIHPSQVEITQKAFLPSDKEIQWANDIMTAFHKHQKEGEGAFTYKGSMIDMPTMKQAQNILDLVNAIMIQENK